MITRPTEPTPRVFSMARPARIAALLAGLLLVAAGVLVFRLRPTLPWRLAAFLLGGAGVLGAIDAIVSRIRLDPEELLIQSVLRRRRYPRRAFVSVKVDGGAVCLERQGGGWVVLPSTGYDSLALRNTLHAWLHPRPGS